jgi:hypothetical protein
MPFSTGCDLVLYMQSARHSNRKENRSRRMSMDAAVGLQRHALAMCVDDILHHTRTGVGFSMRRTKIFVSFADREPKSSAGSRCSMKSARADTILSSL